MSVSEGSERKPDEVRELPCTRPGCGHGPSDHRLDVTLNFSPVNPAAPFRCAVDTCGCPDFSGSVFDRDLPDVPYRTGRIPSAAMPPLEVG